MKIISKFHDYYDTAMAMGVDPNIIYKRETKELDPDNKWFKKITLFSPIATSMNILNHRITRTEINERVPIVLVFCGQIYRGVSLQLSDRYRTEDSYKGPQIICWNIEQLDATLAKYKIPWDKPNNRGRYSYFTRSQLCKCDYELFFQQTPTNQQSIIDLHFNVDCPVIMITIGNMYLGEQKMYLNPSLKKIQFMKCLDAYSTFQQLSMFIGGVMGGVTPKMITIDDNIRLEMHGFDRKESFRKRKRKR